MAKVQLQLFEEKEKRKRNIEQEECEREKDGVGEKKGKEVVVMVVGRFVHWGYFSKQCRLEAIGRLL